MNLSDFDYAFDKSLIAQRPIESRDSSRLLVVERSSGSIRHNKFSDLPQYLKAGDVVVLNDTRVAPVALAASLNGNGKKTDILVLERLKNNAAKCLVRPSGKFKKGVKVYFTAGAQAVVSEQYPDKILEFDRPIDTLLKQEGRMPLPPYIKREPDSRDFDTYQTVYAKNEGAVAAPTAGLHFTDDIFKKIRGKNIKTSFVTLHVGHGTFKPVRCEDITKHRMHKEWFSVPKATIDEINNTRKSGGRIMAVGTTSCKVLETIAGDTNVGAAFTAARRVSGRPQGSPLHAASGFTDLFIYPPYKFKLTDILLTNFHQPRSTLLMLAAAFCGYDLVMEAYREAIEKKYRLFSYGDAMLII